jgi:peptidoglycan/LPS O-acetylase OafA/YrhL
VHWQALDGLRALAVLAVIGIHVGVLPGGYLGVDVFFVLSGFLITTLLINEWDKRGGRVSFRDFYARRVLRLFPALGCVLAVAVVFGGVLLAVAGPGDRPYALATLDAVPWVLVFASNIAQLLHPATLPLGALGHTWSLAVEEQFYLVWPAVFVLLMRRGISRMGLARGLAMLAVAEMIYRIAMAHHGFGHDRIYYGTDTHSDGLLVGCALAFWLSSGHNVQPILAKWIGRASWLSLGALLILFVAGTQASAPLDMTLAAGATGLIVIGIVAGSTPAALERALRARWAVSVGRRSYGLYLWHVLILAIAEALAAPFTGIFPAAGGRRLVFAIALGIAIAASFVAADLSYRFIELPALRFKRRFQSSEVTSGNAAPIAAEAT